MLTLADVQPRDITLELEDISGATTEIKLRALSWVRWEELGLTVPPPEMPRKAVVKNGSKAYEDDLTAYQALQDRANTERNARRLAVALIEAGNFPELKDAPLEEQADIVKQLDLARYNALLFALRNVAVGGRAKIVKDAESFRTE